MRVILCINWAAILVTLTSCSPSPPADAGLGDNPKPAVAFTACTSRDILNTRGDVIVFDSVIENIGNAFSPLTGTFTAPYDGIYSFLVSVDVSNDYWRLKLVKNGQDMVWGDNDAPDGTHITTAAALSLKKGDVTSVIHDSSNGHIDAGRESVFVGYRLG